MVLRSGVIAAPIKLFLKDDVVAQDRWLQDLNWPQILKNFQSSEKHGISLEPPMLELRAIPRTDDREWCRGQQGVFVKHGAYVPRGTVLGPYCCEVYFDAEWNRLKVGDTSRTPAHNNADDTKIDSLLFLTLPVVVHGTLSTTRFGWGSEGGAGA